ncbi:hypothetical protein D9M68_705580 [compost metagenome]
MVLLTVDGLHVPVILLVEVVGSTGAVAPLHNVCGRVNVGVIWILGIATSTGPTQSEKEPLPQLVRTYSW